MADEKVTIPVEGAPAVEEAPAPVSATEVSKDETTSAPETKTDETTRDATPAEEKQSPEKATEGKYAINSAHLQLAVDIMD